MTDYVMKQFMEENLMYGDKKLDNDKKHYMDGKKEHLMDKINQFNNMKDQYNSSFKQLKQLKQMQENKTLAMMNDIKFKR